MNKKHLRALLFVLLTGITQWANATTYTLNIGMYSSAEWNDPQAWSPQGVPGAGDDVIINAVGGNVLSLPGDVTVKSLKVKGLGQINGTGTLTITETLEVTNSVAWAIRTVIAEGANGSFIRDNEATIYSGIYYSGGFIVNGTITSNAVFMNGDSMVINGTVNHLNGDFIGNVSISQSGTLTINSATTVVGLSNIINKGTINWVKGNIRDFNQPIINDGILNISATKDSIFTSYYWDADAPLTNNGTINLAANVQNIWLDKRLINNGTITMAGPSKLDTRGFQHYGTVSGATGSTLQVETFYYGNGVTFYPNSITNVTNLRIGAGAGTEIRANADVSNIKNFDFLPNGGAVRVSQVLPSAATYAIRSAVVFDQSQAFNNTVLIQNGQIRGFENTPITLTFNGPVSMIQSALTGAGQGAVTAVVSAGNTMSVNTGCSFDHVVNNGTVNWESDFFAMYSALGFENNAVLNVNGTATDFAIYYGSTGLEPAINNKSGAQINVNNTTGRISGIINNGTINIAANATLNAGGILEQNSVINGAGATSRLTLMSGVNQHFNAGATTSNLGTIEGLYTDAQFFPGTVFNNITKFDFQSTTIESDLSLPASSIYSFVNSNLRIKTLFEPTTELYVEDSNFEGSGNLRIGNSMIWKGGTMDVPMRVFANGEVTVSEGLQRPIISAPFTNEGTVVLSGGIIEINTGFFKNTGTWRVTAPDDVIIDGYTPFDNTGTFAICGNQPIQISFNVPFKNTASGTFQGEGSYTFNAGFDNLGTASPGCSPGRMVIQDNFTSASGVNIEVEGGADGQYDELIVEGNMTAAGVLNVIVPTGSSLNGSIQVIKTTGAFTGTFSQVNLPPSFTYQYVANGVILTSDGTVSTDAVLAENAMQITPTLVREGSVRIMARAAVESDLQIEVWSASGQLMQSENWRSGQVEANLDVNNLTPGAYFVSVRGADSAWQGRFVKQ
jgi:hypothetical protein